MRIALVRSHDGETSAVDLSGLLASAAAGDESAWREIVRLYARRVFALARSRCGNDDVAEEITQSVFVTVATKLGSGGYSEQGRFEAWMFRVAMNRIRDVIRRSKRRRTAGSLEEGAEPVAPAGRRSDGEEMGTLRNAMERLNEQDREIVELRHHAGMGFREMSELLEEPVGTLLARHHRALRKLREMMTSEDVGSQEGGS